MPRVFRRQRKWARNLLKIFCIRRAPSEENLTEKLEQKLLVELQELRLLNRRVVSPFDDWEQTLWLEGLAVVAPRGASIPVLNICLGFENYELRRLDVNTYSSYCESHWDRVINQQPFARLVCEKYPDEPIVDGLPASIWLECVEPTLSILKSLSILKHRKCNLTSKRNLTDSQMDVGRGNHGDYMYGPFPPLLALPRRGIIRMEIRLGLRTESANLIQGSSFNNQPLSRNLSRRHREKQLYKVLQSYPKENVEVEVTASFSDEDPTSNTENNGRFSVNPSPVSGSTGRNTNQNANIQQGVGIPDYLPDIEVVDLEHLPPDQVPNAEGGDSRPESPNIPAEWMMFDHMEHGMFHEDAQEVINDIVARVVERIGALPALEEDFQGEEDAQGYQESSQSSSDSEEEVGHDEKSDKYRAIFEPRPVPVQEDSGLFYHRGHLVLNNWDLQREDDKCDDRPRYVWNESHRLLEKSSGRVGPPETGSSLSHTLRDFFETETGEWKNSTSGAKLMRLAIKDNYSRRHLMLALNKVFEKRDGDGPMEFHDVRAVNRLSILQEIPSYTPKPVPTSRRGRISMRLRNAWNNLRFRFRMLRIRITGCL